MLKIFFAVAFALTPMVAAVAQEMVPLAFPLEPLTADGVTYSLSASGDASENSGQVRLLVVSENPKDAGAAVVTLRTGKQKTVGDLYGLLSEAFGRFAAGGVPPETVLGKLGDVNHGGAVHFVFEDSATFRFDFLYPDGTGSASNLSDTDVAMFAQILAR